MSIFKKLTILFIISFILMTVIGLWIDNINSKRVDNFAKENVELFKQKLQEYDMKEPTLYLEPGRYIVGDASSEQSTQLLEVKLSVGITSDGKLLLDKMKWQQRQSERPQTDETGVIWIPE